MEPHLFDMQAAVEDRHWWFVGRRRVVRALVEAILPPGRGGRVVDVGAGTGATAASFGGAYEVLAFEPAARAVEVARAKFPALRMVSAVPLASLGADDAGHTAYLLMDVAEHVEDDFRLISDLLAVMAPGSHLILTVPSDPGLWSSHDTQFGHYRRYTPARLAATWQGLPVTVRLFADFNRRLAPAIRLVRWMARAAFGTGAARTDLTIPAGPLNRLLAGILAGERHALVRGLAGGHRVEPTGRAVSLLAVLRREPGACPARDRPRSAPPDSEFRR